jgi:hypothetical protein
VLTTKDAIVQYFKRIGELLPEYEEKTLDGDRLQLSVRNLIFGVVLVGQLESDQYSPYLATSDSEELTETGIGLKVIPKMTRQPADDAEQVAANVRAILGEPLP